MTILGEFQPTRYVSPVSGAISWWFHGKLHRTDGPEIDRDGIESWYDDKGEFHREDGPARIWPDGHKVWYKHGDRHREDGPAIEHFNGIRKVYILNDNELYPKVAINDPELQAKYPKLIESMIIYLVHNS